MEQIDRKDRQRQNPLVSVIVLCYNQAGFVEETLDSVLAQSYPDFELIIMDDCSVKDNSVEVIEKWIGKHARDCVFIKHTENKGICKSLNEAFGYVKGKYLQLIAADDIMLPGKLARQVALLEHASPKDALVFSDAYLIDDNSRLYQNRFIAYNRSYLSLTSGNFYLDLLRQGAIPTMSILYKTEVIKEMGGWDENISFEDYDMLLRVAKQHDFIFDEEISVKYRLHDHNLHKTLDSASNFSLLIKHIDQPIADERCAYILNILYQNKDKRLKQYAREYFIRKKPANFNQFCIKHRIPVKFYNILSAFK